MGEPDSWTVCSVDYEGGIRERRSATGFLSAVSRRFPELRIEKLGYWEPLDTPFSEKSALELWVKDGDSSKLSYCNLILQGSSPVPFYFFVDWYGEGAHPSFKDSIAFWVAREYVQSSSGIDWLLGMFRLLLTMDRPFYGRVTTSEEQAVKNWRTRPLPDGKLSKESISLKPSEGLIDLYWGNYFGVPYLKAFGDSQAKLRMQNNCETMNGGIIVYLSSIPASSLEPQKRLYETLRAQLGDDFFFARETGRKPVRGPVWSA